jgi:hypothetical protein
METTGQNKMKEGHKVNEKMMASKSQSHNVSTKGRLEMIYFILFFGGLGV